MIRHDEAIRIARGLIGTPYGSGKEELDCINLIKRIIRRANGGIAGYTTAGTNSLWDSYNSRGKYRHLVWRQEGIEGAKAGMLAFKRDGSDVHHVGIVTEAGTVVHASSVYGKTVETPLSERDGWNLLGKHRYIRSRE